jgi:hypothetical protein
MNRRTKEFIVAVQDHIPVYGNTSINAFVEGMKSIEPKFMARQTLAEKFEDADFAFFINPSGKVYEIYRYPNPNYQKQNYKKKESNTNDV